MARPAKPLRLRLRADNNIYEIVGPHPVSGRALRVQTGERDEEKAKRYLAEFLAGIDAAPGKPKSADPTLGELLDAFAGQTIAKLASPGTRRQNVSHLKRHLGGIRPWQVSDGLLERYRDLRKRDRWTRPNTNQVMVGVADSTIRREINDLRQALKWAMRQDADWFHGNSLPDFRYPVKADIVRRHDWLTKTVARKICDHAEPHCRLFIELAVRTAARNGAILELTWEQVDLGRGMVDFGAAVGNKERPIQKMPPELIKLLKAAKEIACTDRVIEYGGRPIKSIDTAFEKAVIRAGFIKGNYRNGMAKPKYTVHVLKHTAITWMVQGGMRYDDIAKFAETSIEMIEKVYGHHDPKIAAAAHKSTDF